MKFIQKEEVTILFAGDSGDGIQLTGTQFTETSALFGNDISTFPNFPAEIRAPQGTLAGVSGFQLHFGSIEITTPGDFCDVLVVMNAAAFKANFRNLKKGGIIIANTDGFGVRDLKLANYEVEHNPLKSPEMGNYQLHEIDITKLTKKSLEGSGLGTKEIDRCKNMFVLGFMYWIYNRDLDITIEHLKEKFSKNIPVLSANISVLKAGFHYGETSETFNARYEVKKAIMPKGVYRSIVGNQATAYGLVAASKKSGLQLFFGSYPITPASDILHELTKLKNFGVKTFQAEDEIAAITSSIGAAFGGSLGVTSSSGPGIALKAEAIGLALMIEIPLIIINVQRGGPSTGLPTKTEQADLLQAMYGRNGESPVVVIAAKSPSDCFDTVFEACRLAIEFMTPVFFLSDGYIANGAEPWSFPKENELPIIDVNFAHSNTSNEHFKPYHRNEKMVRDWAIPGIAGLEHRVGGLEKEDITGNISYDPFNHEKMVKIRAAKINGIADYIPLQTIDSGKLSGKLLVLSWGSTYGTIKTAIKALHEKGIEVSHSHLRYINPLPKNLGEIISAFEHVLIPELNNGQLIKIIRDTYLVDAIGLNKIMGLPFTVGEIISKIKLVLNQKKTKI